MKTYKHKEYSYVNVTEIPFSEIEKVDVAMCAEPSQTCQAFYKDTEVKPDVVMNGGMFVMSTGKTIYSLRDEYKNVIADYNNLDGMGIIGADKLVYGKMNDGVHYRDFISAYPMLIAEGKKCNTAKANGINYNARRSVVAWNSQNLFLVTIDSPGMKFDKMQNMLLNMKAAYAVNLDGGGSTCKLVNGTKVTSQVYNRPVDNVICVYLKKQIQNPIEPKPTIYRVQAGAFSSKANANNFCKQIQAVNDDKNYGYAKAYVRLVGKLYKVQIGAFSKRENAERVMADLKSKNINAFITT